MQDIADVPVYNFKINHANSQEHIPEAEQNSVVAKDNCKQPVIDCLI
jgi:hypothetical protein